MLVEKLIPRVESLKIGPSTDPQADYGPMVTRAHMEKVRGYVDLGVKEGAKLVVDGRNFKLQGYENGNFMGGCLFDDVTPEHANLQGRNLRTRFCRWFAPRITRKPCGCRPSTNTATASRSSRATATRRATSPTASRSAWSASISRFPVPLSYYTFGGWKRSGFGDLNQHGPNSIRFYTKTKTVTARWPSGTKEGAEFTIPTMK